MNRTILITMDLKTTKTSGSSYPKPCVAWDHDDFIGNLKVEFITNFITNLLNDCHGRDHRSHSNDRYKELEV